MTEEAGERVWAATETAEAPSGGAVQVVETAAALIPSERTGSSPAWPGRVET